MDNIKDLKMPMPLSCQQTKFLGGAFTLLNIILSDKENPFVVALAKCLGEKYFETFERNAELFKTNGENEDWYLDFDDLHAFYIHLDVLVRLTRMNYFVVFFSEMEAETEYLYSDNISMERIQAYALELGGNVLDTFEGFKTNHYISWYVWRANRFPNPITGISPLLEAYNHIPTLPKNPPQMTFQSYSDKIAVEYNINKGIGIHYKNLNCALTIGTIVGDKENPPAKIIEAYFPNIEKDIMALVSKLNLKDRRRKKVKLTEGEFGTLYACTDLYGRLQASSYHNILPKLEKNQLVIGDKLNYIYKASDEMNALMKTIVDKDLHAINDKFGELQVIKDYRAIATEMVWFDD